MLEGFPGLARGQPGLPAQPVDASVAAILSFLLQYLQESCQGIAVSSGGERATDWAPMVGSLNWPHNWPMRSCITLVSVMRTPPPPPG